MGARRGAGARMGGLLCSFFCGGLLSMGSFPCGGLLVPVLVAGVEGGIARGECVCRLWEVGAGCTCGCV